MTDYQRYKKVAAEFAKRYEAEVSDHIIDVMTSVMLTRDNIQRGGSFAQAIVRNDLYDAISRADSECIHHIKIITLTNKFSFVNQ